METKQLSKHFKKVRQTTMSFCNYLSEDDMNLQVDFFVSPLKWQLAHTTWFFEEMILKQVSTYKVFNKSFSNLFNSYYNTIGERVKRENRGLISRPNTQEVFNYRKHVDKAIIALIDNGTSDFNKHLITLGLQHEQQHQELMLTDLKYCLFQNPIYPKVENLIFSFSKPETGWFMQKEGVFEIGYNGNDFCFDNELGRHKYYLHSFEISKSLVTNKEFLGFIENGGYNKFEYWLDDGWHWVNNNNISAPLYWIKKGKEWYKYTFNGIEALNLEEPVTHISFYEANAYANWKGMRLPTEQEWEIASDNFNWGDTWEWTNSAYLPYPGYKIAEGAVGEYNGKFMINQIILRGASLYTSENHSRKTYRNFFGPDARWQLTGIRLVKN